ncbi:MAG: DUF1573 domain-containing protein [Bacteroidales bacterium]|nr:DUF1573 domain-containing protein [Bacteroidales bacterium]
MEKTRIFISVLLFSVIMPAFNIQRESERKVNSSIEWIKTEHDFGKIRQNIPVTAAFEFKNGSMIPLVILSVEPQCGCTIADYPRKPLKYGNKGVVSISFDAKDMGYFQKSVAVLTNTEEGTTTLIIKGEVIKSGE